MFFKRKDKIIIGVHGLGNKPPKPLLTKWWEEAILEGLKRINVQKGIVPLELAYWADILYEMPLDPNIKQKDHPLYLDEKYSPRILQSQQDSKSISSKIFNYLENQLDKIFLNSDMTINFAAVTDRIINHYFKDLESYFSALDKDGISYHQKICTCLTDCLNKHKSKDILLIAHSMGSIIAYDILSENPDRFAINTLVTIGSPLGLPIIISRIYAEHNKSAAKSTALTAPDNIEKKWFNLADREDRVALDHTLNDDFIENKNGLKATDIQVYNDYERDGEENHHKSFGYLRTLEMAEIINGFLEYEQAGWLSKMFGKTKSFLTKRIDNIKNKKSV